MSSFGSQSLRERATLHPILQEILDEAIKSTYFDFTIQQGWRSPQEQNEMFAAGASKARAGESAHNYTDEHGNPLSLAVDLTPFPHGYKDGQAMLLLAGHILSTAERLGYRLTCGCDWDRDGLVIDTSFKDFWHFELTDWKEY